MPPECCSCDSLSQWAALHFRFPALGSSLSLQIFIWLTGSSPTDTKEATISKTTGFEISVGLDAGISPAQNSLEGAFKRGASYSWSTTISSTASDTIGRYNDSANCGHFSFVPWTYTKVRAAASLRLMFLRIKRAR